MILAPLFVLVLMTFVLGFSLAGVRVPLLTPRRGPAASDVALRQPNWPPRALQLGYSLPEPVRTAGAVLCADHPRDITKHADLLFVVMAWIFVLLRLAHAYVHVTSNNLRLRGMFFGIGALVLAVMWLIFIVQIMLGLP